MTSILAISLFATICIDGTLRGEPKTLCREFQVAPHAYATIPECEKQPQRGQAVERWLLGLSWLQPHLVAERCGPNEPDAEGDDI